MCSSLDHAAIIFIYVGAFIMIYGFVAVWLIAIDAAKKPKRGKLVESYDEWGA